jgi:Zn finger protein HypA/HybF involved in hydrogenase expression
MSIFQTVRDALQASSSATTTDESEGAYWCHDCNERIRDVDVEGEGPPTCPNCDEEMEFERSKGTANCAC